MKPDQYLRKILEQQIISPDDGEYRRLTQERSRVETLLKKAFPGKSPSIRYGGSMAKGTMIRENFDLDLICYFHSDDNSAGESLKDIYENTRKVLENTYFVEQKTSSLRLKGKEGASKEVDFHIDVVPGRFVDKNDGDAFLFQSGAEKERLKTNLQKHIDFIKDSGRIEAIRLAKLWNVRRAIGVKTFVLELLVIKALDGINKNSELTVQLTRFWNYLIDNEKQLVVEDASNPAGNDLRPYLDRLAVTLAMLSRDTLQRITQQGWEGVFGPAEQASEAQVNEALSSVNILKSSTARPWCPL